MLRAVLGCEKDSDINWIWDTYTDRSRLLAPMDVHRIIEVDQRAVWKMQL